MREAAREAVEIVINILYVKCLCMYVKHFAWPCLVGWFYNTCCKTPICKYTYMYMQILYVYVCIHNVSDALITRPLTCSPSFLSCCCCCCSTVIAYFTFTMHNSIIIIILQMVCNIIYYSGPISLHECDYYTPNCRGAY